MLDVMYEVPAKKDIAEAVITAECVNDGKPPKLVRKVEQRTGT